VARLAELAGEGVRIRCRALVTTLWARLALGDLFLHGIGGAKYDQVTDALVWRFFGLAPPRFLVLSATLHLPVARQRVGTEALRATDRDLRRLTYHPECYINGESEVPSGQDGGARELIAAKNRWIRTPSTPDNARTRYEEIRQINDSLATHVAPMRERLLEERHRAARRVRAEAVLTGREYAFCLFPEKTLREFLAALLPKSDQIGFDGV